MIYGQSRITSAAHGLLLPEAFFGRGGRPLTDLTSGLCCLAALTKLDLRKSDKAFGLSRRGAGCLAPLSNLRHLDLCGHHEPDGHAFSFLSSLHSLTYLNLKGSILFQIGYSRFISESTVPILSSSVCRNSAHCLPWPSQGIEI